MVSKGSEIQVKNKIGYADQVKLKRMKPYIKPTKPHQHKDYHEIILITKGEGFHTIEMEKYPVSPPTIYVLSPGQIHHWEFTEKPEGYVLMFKTDLLNEFYLGTSDKFNFSPCIQLSNSLTSTISTLFTAIQKELEQDEVQSKVIIASYIKILITELHRSSSDNSEKTSNSGTTYHQFTNLVKHHFKTHKKVNHFAALLHITPKHLNAICKANANLTASQIIQNAVITEAKRLLIYTDLNISEISHQLGYIDSSHFAKFFKSNLLVSPNTFRKNRFQ